MDSIRVLALGCVVAMTGCGGGGSAASTAGSSVSSAAFSCSPVGGGSATWQSSCLNCPSGALTNPHNSIDTDLSTFADITLYNPSDASNASGQYSLRGTAQNGIVFPAGSRAGLIFGLPTGSNVQYSVSVNTYLSGTLQETTQPISGHTGSSAGGQEYIGFSSTTKPFDGVEVSIAEIAPDVEQHHYQVYEFCGDGSTN